VQWRLWSGDEFCLLDAQGKMRYLGTFRDPVAAALRYDEEAIEQYGGGAILNFPHRASPPVVPVLGGHCEEPSTSAGLLPAGIPEGTHPPVAGSLQADDGGPKVRLASWFVSSLRR
jgi:hypothetical protein